MNNIITAVIKFAGFVIFGILLSPVTDAYALHVEGKPHSEVSLYIGSEVCGECHQEAYKAWESTRLATALIVLGPRKVMKTKKKMGLDPYRDYTKDPGCLKCHTTGFEIKADGSYTFAEYGIGCEVCHGPGRHYSEIMRSRGKVYKRHELVEAGLNSDFELTCLMCHNEESPLIQEGYLFSHKERYKKVHGTIKLKYHEKIERFPEGK